MIRDTLALLHLLWRDDPEFLVFVALFALALFVVGAVLGVSGP